MAGRRRILGETTLKLRIICAALAAVSLIVGTAGAAFACGCLSPPVPEAMGSYAVNQQAEQIIFEKDGDHIVAHVLIRYAGDPAEFAWLVPVPSVPELELSSTFVFPILDRLTQPQVVQEFESVCPDPEYRCEYHDYPSCFGNNGANNGVNNGFDGTGQNNGGNNGANNGDGVVVYDRKKVGAYETVTFGAGDADAAVNWLRNNDFIVNDTMTPYMQPYLDAGMLFVASKLQAGAGLDELRPLRMRYEGTQPMIPLRLTAVAAEPHLTVTAYIFGEGRFAPVGHPVTEIDPSWLAPAADRSLPLGNYPAALSRAVDAAGGDAFVLEYFGSTPELEIDDPSGCCSGGTDDFCSIGGDGQCQCPGAAFDSEDCGITPEELETGFALIDTLRAYPRLTRITTRLSPEEMTFDPAFQEFVDDALTPQSRPTQLVANQKLLIGCETDVIDKDTYITLRAQQQCATTYCGEGECVITGVGPGCDCNSGFVARRFTDYDGEDRVTCVPASPPVDFGADGLELPDACAGLSCGANGTCLDVGGFPSCQCDDGFGASLGARQVTCAAVEVQTGGAGADNYSNALEDLDVCAPQPYNCGPNGWLVENTSAVRHGVMCETSIPDPAWLRIPPAPRCEGDDGGADDEDAGCTTAPGSVAPLGGLALVLGWLFVARRRRQSRR